MSSFSPLTQVYVYARLQKQTILAVDTKISRDQLKAPGNLAKQVKEGLEGRAWLIRNGKIFPEKNPDTAKPYTVNHCFPERLLNAGDL